MEITFITIHDLSQDARILYSSDSIVDILGHTPDEVVGRAAWDFFHPEELPLARHMHNRGVKLDKAAVLAYCRILSRQGDWVGCECCFSVVHDVMVCCTSVYRRGLPSQKRAAEAPIVRRLFSSSPKDPRYHMLSHLSTKFKQTESDQTHEPRAALFLNRFTRTLTIMYATSGIEEIIGISSEAMKGRSFYYCIAENCLQDAVRCLESAKGNDSIAYLRFWFRDPRLDDPPRDSSSATSSDDEMTDITTDDEEGSTTSSVAGFARDSGFGSGSGQTIQENSPSHLGTQRNAGGSGAQRLHSPSSSSATPSVDGRHPEQGIELEAVVSCTSDGLVVCLRRAHPLLPTSIQPQTAEQAAPNGIFAAPWAAEPVFYPPLPQAVPYGYYGANPHYPTAPRPQGGGGPLQQEFMRSIRDVAVFAWALAGINGSLTDYSLGTARGESQPPEGFPIWAPDGTSNGNTPSIPGSGYGSASNTGYSPNGDSNKRRPVS